MKRDKFHELHSLLPVEHQRALRAATHGDRDAVIALLRKESPQYFHVEHGENQTLRMREFVDEPGTEVLCRGWLRDSAVKRRDAWHHALFETDVANME